MHRSQGVTLEGNGYRVNDGGGRELAYVSMSRARRGNYILVEADGLDQAVEDLRRDWGAERREQWVIDTERSVDGIFDRVEADRNKRLEEVLDESVLDPLRRSCGKSWNGRSLKSSTARGSEQVGGVV